MRFCLLGPLEVLGPDGALTLGGPKQRAVLAVLALNANRVVPADRLIAAVWGDDAADGAQATLQVYISNLRKILKAAGNDTAILSRRPGYLLGATPGELDILEFDALVADGRTALAGDQPAVAAGALHRALDLWRGQALADLRDEPFAGPDVVRLEQARLAAIEDRVDADLALGRHSTLVPELETLVGANPLRERMWGQLIVALYRCERQADALASYGRARSVLADELGLDPGPALRELERAVLAQDLEGPPPAARSVTAPAPARIPRPASRLIGREDEVAELVALVALDGERLVTLTGPGGSGKTRLALELAHQAAERFAGGAYFVDLSAVLDAELVLATAAGAIGSTPDALADTVQDRDVLLVLDNFEHVLDAAPVVAELLAAAPRLHVVVTSRTPLRVSGEIEHHVAGLAVPGPDGELHDLGGAPALRLFVARARAVQSDFALDAATAPLVVDICRQLDGLPLAIELAAARLRLLSLHAVHARLDRSLGLLTSGQRDAPARQRTLRATIQWSVDLLDPPERDVLGHLAVFVGDFRLEAALAVCGDDRGDAEDRVDALLGSSLLRRSQSRDDPTFRVLETVRQFAAEQLLDDAGRAAATARFVAHYASAAKDALAHADGPGAAQAAHAVDAEFANFTAALDAAPAVDVTAAAQIAVGLTPSWLMLGRVSEARFHLARLLEHELPPAEHPAVRAAAARLAYQQNDLDDARNHALAAGDGDDADSVLARCIAAAVAVGTGAVADGRVAAQAALDTASERGYYAPHVVALSVLAIAAATSGEFATEKSLYEQRLASARAHGDRVRIADTLTTLGEIAFDEADYPAATAFVREALDMSDAHSRPESRDALILLGRIALADEAPDRAAEFLDEALQRAVEVGQPAALALCLRAHAAMAMMQGDADRAARLFGVADAMQPRSVVVNPSVEQDLTARREQARGVLGAEAFERASAAGAQLDQVAAIQLANRPVGNRAALAG